MCAIASTRNSFFEAEGMRASIAKDVELAGGPRSVSGVRLICGTSSGFRSQLAPKLAVERGARKRQPERRDSFGAGLQISDSPILLRALECVERGGSRGTHLA